MEKIKTTVLNMQFIGEYSLLIGLIILGATSNALTQLDKARKEDRKFDYIDVIIALVVSIFSGVLFGITASWLWDDQAVLYGVSAVGAFLGLSGLNKITDAILETLVKKIDKE